jgi:site-specific DNA recombinase
MMNLKTNEKEHRRKAVLYCRVSSKDQAEGFSIPSQLKFLNSYALDKGFTVAQEFIDIESAKNIGRTGFTDMMNFFRRQTKIKKPCRVVLSEKVDRLYRNIRDWVAIDELDLEIHFAKEGVVLSRDSHSSEKFMHGIKVLMAKNYIDNLSEEVKKGLTEKAEQGHWPSVAPVGYLNNLETHQIEIDLDRAPLIRKMFEKYATGHFSLMEISRWSEEEGFRHPRSGKPICKVGVHRIIQNPIYFGNFIWNGKTYQGVHKPIITRELFEQVQAVLKGHNYPVQTKRSFSYRGFLTCGRCGCNMTAELQKETYIYYRCTGYKGKCGNHYVREEKLGDLLGDVLKGIKIDESIVGYILEALKSSQEDKKTFHAESVERLERRAKHLQGILDMAYEDKLSGKISEDYWCRRSQDWEAEILDCRMQISRHEEVNFNYYETGTQILELAKQAHSLYLKQNHQERRRLLDQVVSNCTYDRGSLSVSYRKPFDILAEGLIRNKWRGRRDLNSRPPA